MVTVLVVVQLMVQLAVVELVLVSVEEQAQMVPVIVMMLVKDLVTAAQIIGMNVLAVQAVQLVVEMLLTVGPVMTVIGQTAGVTVVVAFMMKIVMILVQAYGKTVKMV
jgi:uncharacterized protein YbcI